MTSGAVLLASSGVRGRRRSGLIGTLVVLLLAAIGIVAGLEVSRQGGPLLDDAAAEIDVAHLVLYGDAEAVGAAAADREVVAASGPFATLTGVELANDGEVVPFQLTALDDPDIEVNRPLMRDGRWLGSEREIVLDRSAGEDLGITIGETITLDHRGVEVSFDVVGTAVSFTDCLYPQCEPARAWVTGSGLDRFGAGDDVFAQEWLRFGDPAQADPFVQHLAAGGVEGIGGTESWLDTRADFLTLDRFFGSFVVAFGGFVLVVSAVVIAGSTAIRVLTRRREIGLLGALGCTPGQIVRGLLVENLALGLLATLVGWGVGGLLVPGLQIGVGRTLGPQDPVWTPVSLAVCAAVIGGLLTLATALPARSAARRPVTDVLRDAPTDGASALQPEGGPRAPPRLALLGAQDVISRPTRAALAALAIVVAVVGTIVSLGFVGGLDAVADDPARAGDPWDLAVVPGGGVVAVEQALTGSDTVSAWFPEVERRSTLDGGAFLSVAVGGEPADAPYRIAGGAPLTRAGEAIAGYGFLQRFGVDVGDEVDVLVGTSPLHLRIVGWYRDTEDSGEILRYRLEDLLAVEPEVVPGVYRVALVPSADRQMVADALSAQLGPDVRIELLDTGAADMAPLLAVLDLVAALLLLMAGVNLLSTLLTSQRESAGRLGVQIAVGFTPRQVVAQGAVSGAALGLVAAVVGVPLGLVVFRLLSDVVSEGIGVGPAWMPMPGAVALLVLAVGAVTLSALLGALSVLGIVRRSTADLVRGE